MEAPIPYDTLVNDILKVPALKNYIDEEKSKGSYINLVCPDWKERLKNYGIYQRHNNRYDDSLFHNSVKAEFCETQFVKPNDKICLMLALPCRIGANYDNAKSTFSVYSRGSEPIMMVAQAMARSKSNTHKVIDESKFVCEMCDSLICTVCSDYQDYFEKRGMEVTCANPCIKKTKVYDGKNIRRHFSSQIQSAFQSREFIAILHVEIYMRLMYNRKSEKSSVVRISGRFSKMLAFDFSKLIQDNEPYDFDDELIEKANKKSLKGKKRKMENEEDVSTECIPFEEMNREYDENVQKQNVQIINVNRAEDPCSSKSIEEDKQENDEIIEAIPDNLNHQSCKKKMKSSVEVEIDTLLLDDE